ncbi:hypothetical protein [Rahnella aquatilis]|uniref:Uncharacterized protein n=1 Tax=Rahnella aquatilis (strain ATCC 33071 / DSM 4594 / JCM 1683 / NBRC 105701 / NCIMB 13365 / CIP 78.65) TaxID=745277 RepID=H2J1W6_RAHAC|nr:hypothetical protein [Rahnella aquatilis]AEX54563.1 hypothetical protein Rahaq2_4844 [Rahnella aquatilis CIP 78.65 = ATCC 33071]KFD00026.1 hypothetical protein GRAQ_04610 [Rahnella aquatilis CIP 78.65 = ATCC 33071]
MAPVASISGGIIFIIVGIVMLWLLVKAHKGNTSKKFFTPHKCMLLIGTLVSFVISIVFFTSSS